jgi:hypothetical protein
VRREGAKLTVNECVEAILDDGACEALDDIPGDWS